MEIKLTKGTLLIRKVFLKTIMKLFIFLFYATVFAFTPSELVSQNVKVKIDKNETLTVDEVFKIIMDQTDYVFFYEEGMFKDFPLVDVKKGTVRVNKLLINSLSKENLEIEVTKNNGIIIKDIPTEDIIQSTISGTISDESGVPLAGASIIEKGTTNGVTSDFNGNFVIESIGQDVILVVSFIGYTTKEVQVTELTNLNIVLEESATGLDQIIVVGYGSQNKRSVTSAIATLNSEDLGENTNDSFTRALSGKVTGVQVQQTTGAPGGALKVRVRGTGSLNASNDPLYVIDGIPVENSNFGNGANDDRNNIGFNPLSTLNPFDIESVQVLKDAAASAIYGSRGANGVVIITTKRGKSGKPQFSLTTSMATQSVHNKVDLLSGDQFLDFLRESWTNAAATTKPGLPMLGFLSDESQYRGVNTDWQDVIFRSAIVQNYQLSVSGGTDKFQYFVSGGFLDEEGIIIESGFKRYSLRANLDAQLTDKLKFGVSITPSFTSTDEVKAEGHWASGGVILSSLIALPFLPPNASTEDFVNSQPDYVCCGTPNPGVIARERETNSTATRLLSNAFLEYEIVNGLKAKTSLGFDYIDFERNDFQPAITRRNNNNTSATNEKTGQRSWLLENTLDYNQSFGKHNINLLGGFTYQEFRSQNIFLGADGLQNPSLRTITSGDFDKLNQAASNISEWSLVSLLGRLNYSFDNKYLLSAAIRRDGSSRFGGNNKYASFPSLSLGWLVSEENFLKDSEKINLLKLRASYGETGNNRIGNYGSVGLLGGGANYVLGSGNGTNIGGLALNSIANPDLTWETTKQYGVGLELGLFNNRIGLTVDYFKSRTEDLLLQVPIPATTGLTSSLQNLGKIENKGWEFLLSTKNFANDFVWETDFNITFTKNKILELGPEGDPIRFGSGRGNVFLNEIGGELGAFNVYKPIGIFQTPEEVNNSATFPRPTFPGDVKYQDTDGDGVITDADRVVVGSNRPDFVWGITNTFRYKNWDLSVLINGTQGNLIHNVQGAFTLGLQGYMNQYASTLGRWRSASQPGDGRTPRATFDTTGNNSIAETGWWIEDGSFIRIQNVSLGYNFSPSVTEKLGLSSFRLFLSGNNLATFTDYQGYNPEVSYAGGSPLSAGADYGTYPLATRITLGLKVGF
ncbi:TonB-dependent receptor [Sabulilitoribacter arenilitoris]|uniref:TonB-dependent receptor n=1 Tax=Wocania arenilitoris TaxID=2044858 RepID=A0AAE3JJM8_9FLAO|nr:TonB-dependent receptor [Wocania arenilitoris]MCF7567188.1 TonB-dependent receptor [Wocania arenilitoris]